MCWGFTPQPVTLVPVGPTSGVARCAAAVAGHQHSTTDSCSAQHTAEHSAGAVRAAAVTTGPITSSQECCCSHSKNARYWLRAAVFCSHLIRGAVPTTCTSTHMAGYRAVLLASAATMQMQYERAEASREVKPIGKAVLPGTDLFPALPCPALPRPALRAGVLQPFPAAAGEQPAAGPV